VDWDTTQNLVIEGDNLEVLKLLQKSYSGRAKLIYIDPPYNTGNEFIYEDHFASPISAYLQFTGQVRQDGLRLSSNSESDGRYHTSWLNMIYPRLKIARNLLSVDGLIAISIDDHEAHNMRNVCDEVFGPENFVANLIWQSRTSISNDQEVSLNHNHTLLYSRSRDRLRFYGEPLKQEEYSNPDNDPRGDWKLVPIDANKPGGDTRYPIVNPKTGVKYYPPNGRSWAFNPDEYRRLLDDGRIKFGLTDESAPKKKLYLKERLAKGDTKTPSSILLDAGTTKDGTTEMMELFDGKKVFDYPKPTTLLTRLLEYTCNPGDDNLVIDFFAGSCAMGHACMSWRRRDARFIMVQLPEPVDTAKNYARIARSLGFSTLCDIGIERLRRVSKHTKDLGFRVFKLDSSNIRAWEPDPADLERTLLDNIEHIKADRSEQDVLYELLLKLGLDLCVPIETRTIDPQMTQMDADQEDHHLRKSASSADNSTPSADNSEESAEQQGFRVHAIGAGVLMACLDTSIPEVAVEPLALGIVDWHRELAPVGDSTVVFRDSAFANDVAKTNLAAILQQHGLQNVRSL